MKNQRTVIATGLLISSLAFSTQSAAVPSISGTYVGNFNPLNITCSGASQFTPPSLYSISQNGDFFNGTAAGPLAGLSYSGHFVDSRHTAGTYQFQNSAGITSSGSYVGTIVSEDSGYFSSTGTYSDPSGGPCSVTSQGTLTRLTPAPFFEASSSSSLSSTSPSSASSRLVYSKLDPGVFSHRERLSQLKQTNNAGVRFVLADLKYEQVRYTNSGEDGHIAGLLMSLSTEIAGVEVGAYIPYDYLNFESFTGHRTGTVLYAKRDWQLPYSLQLTTMANFNYMATYISQMAWTNTFGGGVESSLSYDNGGDFVPRVSIAFQYNQDDYYKANDIIKDNHQFLVKTGASLGYRLFENATLRAGLVYTSDVTDYKSYYNSYIKDNDYFELIVGGSYAIADMWQVNLSYKRILGLKYYYSNAVFLGTTIGF